MTRELKIKVLKTCVRARARAFEHNTPTGSYKDCKLLEDLSSLLEELLFNLERQKSESK